MEQLECPAATLSHIRNIFVDLCLSCCQSPFLHMYFFQIISAKSKMHENGLMKNIETFIEENSKSRFSEVFSRVLVNQRKS